MRLIGGQSEFETLHKAYNYFVDGMQYTPKDRIARTVNFIDFDHADKNIFKVVNQFTVEYVNNNERKTRRPDILLYVNGFPLCIIELKNPADDKATIHDAFEQITVRYWRDIPHLLHYCPLACISDGVKTRLGTVKTPYEIIKGKYKKICCFTYGQGRNLFWGYRLRKNLYYGFSCPSAFSAMSKRTGLSNHFDDC